MRPELLETLRPSLGALHARAWHTLKHSFDLPPSASGGRPFHGIPRLCLWDDATGFRCDDMQPFTLTVFEIYGDNLSRHPVVRETVWRRDDDLRTVQRKVERSRKVAIIDPTIDVRDGPVPPAELAALLKEATAFRVPVVWLSPEGCESVTDDVGARGFEFFSREQPPAVLRLQWSCEMPKSWRPIIDWFEKIRSFLVSCLPETKIRCNPQ